MNCYNDDPPPYPGHEITTNSRPITTNIFFRRLSNKHEPIVRISNDENYSKKQHTIQARQWRTAHNQYRVCYIGNLSDDFLRIKISSKSQVDKQAKLQNNSFTRASSDQSIILKFAHFNTNASSVKSLKTSKVHARMLRNILSDIEQGKIRKIPMVLEEPITQNVDYFYGTDDLFSNRQRIPFTTGPFITDYDLLQSESENETNQGLILKLVQFVTLFFYAY
ncbi:unnamed protein product [Rotaria socialis]|uniref:Uncharacterized protein n=1 Tax=Rotaria socialis TaxID=392032 RepID=A0A821CJS6_9BILA|nr:unnamed protein product [Rotaria socialis]